MKVCSGAHHCARKLITMGHAVKFMAPQFVRPYVKTNKNDAADADDYIPSNAGIATSLFLRAMPPVLRHAELSLGTVQRTALRAAGVV